MDGLENGVLPLDRVMEGGTVRGMVLGSEREVVPLGAGFDIVKRGYSRAQVEEHLQRLDGEVRLMAADRDGAVSQAADLARQLERGRADIEELRVQVDRLSKPPATLEGLSERLQRMLRLTQDEANEIRARAEADANHIRGRSEAEGAALRNRYEKLITELDGRRTEMEGEHRAYMDKARADIEAEHRAADDERKQLDKQAEIRRQQVEDDFEIAMSSKRAESMRVLAEHEATSKAEADKRLRESTEEANRIRALITEERRTSKEEAERRLREATEEATRIRTLVADERQTSKVEAETRLREATEEANRRRHEAATEAQARLQDAIEESTRRVREATEDADRRVTHATNRVEALRALRAQIADQLRDAHELIVKAAPALDPLPEEKLGTSDAGQSSLEGKPAQAASNGDKPGSRDWPTEDLRKSTPARTSSR
jgi:hypothetical protein